MAVSVVEPIAGTAAVLGATASITFTATPAAGDVVVLMADLRGTRAVTAVTGMGGTWAEVYSTSTASNGSSSYWVGTGVSSTGLVTATISGTASDGRLAGLLVRGLPAPVIAVGASTLTLASPSATTDVGELVVSQLYNRASMAGITGTGWSVTTKQTSNSTDLQFGWYIPSAPVTTSITSAGTATFAHADIVRLRTGGPQSFAGAAATEAVTAGVGSFRLPGMNVAEIAQGTVGGATATVTLAATPEPGDLVYLAISTSAVRAVTSVTGLGATWSQVGAQSVVGSQFVWQGVGATSAGVVTVTLNVSASGSLRAFLVQGITDTVAAAAATNSGSTGAAFLGPEMPAGAGQFVILVAFAGAKTSGNLLQGDTPSDGWQIQAGPAAPADYHHTGYRIPAEAPTTHRASITAGTIAQKAILTVVVGPSSSIPQSFTGSGVVEAVTAAAGSFVAHTPLTPQAFTGKAVTEAVTAGVGSFAARSPSTTLGASLTVSDVQVLDVVQLTGVTLGAGATVTVADLSTVTMLTDVTLAGGATLTARPRDDAVGDPRTGGRQWRYVVTDLQGAPLGELVDIVHDPLEDGVNEPTTMSFTIGVDDPAYPLIRPVVRQCQVWHGNTLRLRGPILPGNPSDDGTTVTHTVHDPSWWWRDGRKRIGWVPKSNLLKNGDFTQGLAWWTRGFDKDSIPAAAPTVRVVDDDFTDGGKAAEIVGIETVTQVETELESSAVYWPNRPYSYEPLAAGFRPGGEAAIDNVAKDMPTTDGLKVTIVGHTANDGTGDGMELSLRRALAAKARVQALRPKAVITTKGVGFYQPNPKYPIDSQQQRRVVIGYESKSVISGKSKQWIKQTVEVTQPKSAAYGLELVAASWLNVKDDWSIEDANMISVRVTTRRSTSPTIIREDASSSISDTDPVNRWLKAAASVTIPADGRTYLVDVYLYAPASLTRYTRAVLEPQEILYFWGADQALIVKGVIEHMQDPRTMLGVTWPITVDTRTPRTGVKRDRQYPHSTREPIDTVLEEFPSLYRGLDIDTLTTTTDTTVATFYPQQGQTVDYPLVLGGNVTRAAPASTRDVASLIIAQAQDQSSARDEAYAGDKRALGGLMLQSLITAEQDTPLNELDETAKSELKWAKVTTPAYWLDIDPDAIVEVLTETGKGDIVRLLLDGPLDLDALVRIVKREIHPDGLRLMVALQEA